MIEVEFNNANYDVIKQNWDSWLNIRQHTGVVTNYNEKKGKALLFILEIEKGLIITISDYTAKDDIIFINKAYTANNNSLFTLNYLVMGNVYVVKDRQENEKQYILNKIVLHHSKSNFSFIAPKEKRARAIDIIFSHEWLLNQFNSQQQQAINTSISKIENRQSFYIDPISSKSFEFAREILDKIFYDEWDYFFLKPRIIFLIEEFVKNYILSENKEHQKSDNNISSPMMAIKQKINTILYEKLPSRKALAKEFLMSESTLDRHFKKSFGKTINEYHLGEKMKLAKRILLRDEYTISQIAYLLGYETVSAFIKSFKGHFGIPPGSFKKISTDNTF